MLSVTTIGQVSSVGNALGALACFLEVLIVRNAQTATLLYNCSLLQLD